MDFQLSFVCSNFSQDVISPELWVLEEVYRNYTLSIGVVLSIFLLIGIPWNSVVIIVILKNRLFVQPAIVLLLNLAVTDLLLCVLVMPFNIVSAFADEFLFGSSDYVRCQVCQMGIMLNILLLMSVYNVTLLSLDRFLYVRVPMRYEKIVTTKRVILVLTLCWFVFMLFSLLPLLGIGTIGFSQVISTCAIKASSMGPNIKYLYLWMYVAVACFVPIIILLVTNIWMLCIVKKGISKGFHRAVRNSLGQGGRPSLTIELKDKYKRNQIRLLQIFGAIFCANIITWVPILGSLILLVIVIVPGVVVFAHLCLLFQAVIHPILQVLLLRDIRVEFSHLFYLCSRQCRARFGRTLITAPNDEDVNEDTEGVCSRKCLCCSVLDTCAVVLTSYHSRAQQVQAPME